MPYKAEKIKLSETQDRRRKLTEKQKEEIKAIYATGVCGTRPLAKKFGVSKSTVHKDVSERLLKINPNLAHQVREILNENKAERHIRGGMATKLKYSHEKVKYK